jgi:alpha,alpha-trehalose phosphorylase
LIWNSTTSLRSTRFRRPAVENVAAGDPRRAKMGLMVLRPVASRARDRRIVLVHGTGRSRMLLSCAVNHQPECECPNRYTTEHNENFGQVAFTIDAKPAHPIHLNKYMG